MDKLLKIRHFGGVLSRISLTKPFVHVRTLLSDSFNCNQEWGKRLEEPIIRNIKLEEFTYEMDKKYARVKSINAVDVDLFAHKVTEEGNLGILEEMVYRLRRSPNTIHTLQSTGHGFIRTLLQFGKLDDILDILDDRVNFGVFPDHYLNCLLMDTFIKSKNYVGAAKIASFMMLQEDFGHPLSQALALYSCHMYVKHPEGQWYKVEEEEEKKSAEDEEDDEINEQRERVDWLREPHFDDHFDLREPKYLVGKTLVALGKLYDGIIGRSYQIVGLSMYRKWDEVKKLVEKMSGSVTASTVDIVNAEIASIISEEKRAQVQKEFETLLANLKAAASNESLDDLVDKLVRGEISKSEQEIISKQKETYTLWAQHRDQALKAQIHAQLREHMVKTIREKKIELTEKEELLYFFDNFEQLALQLENQPELGPEIPAFDRDCKKIEWHITDLDEDYVDDLFMPPDSLREKFSEPSEDNTKVSKGQIKQLK